MKKVVWEVRILSAPPVLKYCKKCGRKTEFAQSGQFRVNAQLKRLDVWLIYKCSCCDSTWNAAILSRVSPGTVPSRLLERFHSNDEALAKAYAMDTGLVQRNGWESGSYKYKVTGEDIIFDEPAELMIKCEYDTSLKVSAVLRDKLGLTRRMYEELLYNGTIESREGKNLGKCRLGREAVLYINADGR